MFRCKQTHVQVGWRTPFKSQPSPQCPRTTRKHRPARGMPACCGRLASRADGPTQGQAAEHACQFRPHGHSLVVSLIHKRPVLEQKDYISLKHSGKQINVLISFGKAYRVTCSRASSTSHPSSVAPALVTLPHSWGGPIYFLKGAEAGTSPPAMV